MRVTFLLSAVLSLTVLAGCTGISDGSVSATPPEPVDEAPLAEKAPAKLLVIPFPEDALYDLLVGDIALLRSDYTTGLEFYLRQAHATRDRGVIELTMRLAEHMRDSQTMREVADLWLEIEPENPAAHQAALLAFAANGDPVSALNHAFWLFNRDNNAEPLIKITTLVNADNAEHYEALLAAYSNLPLNEDQKPLANYARALLFRQLGNNAAAEREARQFVAANPADRRGTMLLAELVQERDAPEEAIALIESALKNSPDDYDLRLHYARLLARTDREKSLIEFERLHADQPQNHEITYLLGLLKLNNGDIEEARELLLSATTDAKVRADARYHLGRIADLSGDTSQAMAQYRRVRSGRHFLPSAARVTELYAKQGELNEARQYLHELRVSRPDYSVSLFQIESNLLVNADQPGTALTVLTEGLSRHPNDVQLLYARSMVAETQNDFAQAEQDLRNIIEQDQDNAMALNALGYTMILHTDRHQEAHELILRAYQLNPDDPAIIDSLGWVLFHLGDHQQALHYLEQAMALAQDPEIASHLGEVQWTLGKTREAMQTWQTGLQEAPGHKGITSTMQRLGAQLDKAED